MKLYKFTDKNGNTRDNTHWAAGITHTVSGVPRLCSPTVLHAYTSPLLAELMHPAHVHFNNDMLFFECEGEVLVTDGTKFGCQSLTAICEINRVSITVNQRIAFGILCSLETFKDSAYKKWAISWLDGSDRSESSARRAADAAARYGRVIDFQSIAEKAMQYA